MNQNNDAEREVATAEELAQRDIAALSDLMARMRHLDGDTSSQRQLADTEAIELLHERLATECIRGNEDATAAQEDAATLDGARTAAADRTDDEDEAAASSLLCLCRGDSSDRDAQAAANETEAKSTLDEDEATVTDNDKDADASLGFESGFESNSGDATDQAVTDGGTAAMATAAATAHLHAAAANEDTAAAAEDASSAQHEDGGTNGIKMPYLRAAANRRSLMESKARHDDSRESISRHVVPRKNSQGVSEEVLNQWRDRAIAAMMTKYHARDFLSVLVICIGSNKHRTVWDQKLSLFFMACKVAKYHPFSWLCKANKARAITVPNDLAFHDWAPPQTTTMPKYLLEALRKCHTIMKDNWAKTKERIEKQNAFDPSDYKDVDKAKAHKPHGGNLTKAHEPHG